MKKLKKLLSSRRQIIIFAVVFGIIGGLIIIRGFAAAPTQSSQGDVDGNHQVNGQDLSIVLKNIGSHGPAGDADSNGVVDGHDLSVVLSHFSQ